MIAKEADHGATVEDGPRELADRARDARLRFAGLETGERGRLERGEDGSVLLLYVARRVDCQQ